jgi:hypothetical protein
VFAEAASVNDSEQDQLRKALMNAQSKLGEMEPWKKVLFQEEVIPQYQRFIRDYRATPSGGFQVDVDFESIKRYLLFYAPKTLKTQDTKVVVLLKTDTNCQKCSQSYSAMQAMVKSRLDHRGLRLQWVNPDEFPPQVSGSSLEDLISPIIKAKNASGALMLQWAPAPVDDLDTVHADEKRYLIQAYFRVGDHSIRNRQKELLENDSFEAAGVRLMTDVFTDLGTKIEWEDANILEKDKEEILVEVSGIQDFSQYSRVRATLQAQFKDAVVEDRKLSRDQIVFGIYTKKKTAELKRELSELNLDPGGGQLLTVVVK